MAVTTIPISKEFHDWLKGKGKKGESYENVIKRLLKPEYQQELEGSIGKEESTQEHTHDSNEDLFKEE